MEEESVYMHGMLCKVMYLASLLDCKQLPMKANEENIAGAIERAVESAVLV